MNLSAKQKAILSLLESDEATVTKDQAVEECIRRGLGNYANTRKYVGETLSRMVKQRLLVRIKPGLFKKGSGTKRIDHPTNPAQKELF